MKRRRKNESGYALLLILLMGALLAISLYREIPRVAFETQRQKEQLLIERGEQYKRAIQLFYRKNARYPQKIEDLENTNNIRYLRKRYKDPMTGKDEWRVVHMVNGILTDSKVQTQKNQDTKNKGPFSTYLGEVAGLGQQLPPGANGQPGATSNPALRRRASDGVPGGDPTMPGGQGGMAGITGQPGMPPGVPGMPGMVPGQPGVTGQPMMGQPGYPNPTGIAGLPPGMQPGMQPVGVAGQIIPGGRGGVPGIPGSTPPGAAATTSSGSSYLGGGSSYLGGGSYLGGQPSNPTGVGVIGGRQQYPTAGQQYPGGGTMPMGGQFPPGTPVNSQTGGVAPVYNTAAGSNGTPPGFNQPGINISPQAQNAAAQMIGQILTQPRQGGMPMSNSQGAAAGGTGIAGFASNADQDSIMVYNDQTNYGLWEFIFDPAKQKAPLNIAGGGQPGTPASQIGNQIGTPANQVGQPVAPSPFGGGAFGPAQGGRGR